MSKVHIDELEKAKRIDKIATYVITAFVVLMGIGVLFVIGTIIVSCFTAGFWGGITCIAVILGLGLGVWFISLVVDAQGTIEDANRNGVIDD